MHKTCRFLHFRLERVCQRQEYTHRSEGQSGAPESDQVVLFEDYAVIERE